MDERLRPYLQNIPLTQDIPTDVTTILEAYNYKKVATHVGEVAAEISRLATMCNAAQNLALAGWLHDISAIIPNAKRVQLSHHFGLEVLPEERQVPMLLHQKLSAVMAKEVWGITDTQILSAIACHTTLKANAAQADKIMFLADKISWDQAGTPPYLDGLLTALADGLDTAVFYFLHYLWQRKDKLQVVHPYFVEAYQDVMRHS
mgnify:CR=1 FL=1